MLCALLALTNAQNAPSNTLLRKNAPLELWHGNKLRLANFKEQAKDSAVLKVTLDDGQAITVDRGQIVRVWETGSSEDVPINQFEWNAATASASSLIRELPPHMLDLKHLWGKKLKKNAKYVFSTDDVADILFKPKQGQNTQPGVSYYSAARRIAAGQLLAEERNLFKRQRGQMDPDHPCEGGFQLIKNAQIQSRTEMSLSEKFRIAREGGRFSASPTELPLLGELEMLALGLGSHDISTALNRLLSISKYPISSDGARRLLLDVGLWVNEDENKIGDEETTGSRSSQESLDGNDSSGVTALAELELFPRESLILAEKLGAEILERRKRYAEMPYPSRLSAEVKPVKGTVKGSALAGALSRAIAPVDPADGIPEAEACKLDYRVDLRKRFPRYA